LRSHLRCPGPGATPARGRLQGRGRAPRSGGARCNVAAGSAPRGDAGCHFAAGAAHRGDAGCHFAAGSAHRGDGGCNAAPGTAHAWRRRLQRRTWRRARVETAAATPHLAPRAVETPVATPHLAPRTVETPVATSHPAPRTVHGERCYTAAGLL
jgi:hypothetical protein